MKSYFIEEFLDSSDYENFIHYMITHSTYFSLVYFKYKESEKMKKSTRKIHDLLKPFKYKSFFTNMWPGTFTLNQSNAIYKVILYHSDSETIPILSSVKGLYNWNYPIYPMDLCFYRNEYCWMDSTTHEHLAHIYSDDMKEIALLKHFNDTLSFHKETENNKLFRIEDLKSKYADKPYWER